MFQVYLFVSLVLINTSLGPRKTSKVDLEQFKDLLILSLSVSQSFYPSHLSPFSLNQHLRVFSRLHFNYTSSSQQLFKNRKIVKNLNRVFYKKIMIHFVLFYKHTIVFCTACSNWTSWSALCSAWSGLLRGGGLDPLKF